MRVKRKGETEHFVGRRYGDFARLHQKIRNELPGKVLPPLPKKNKSSSSGLFSRNTDGGDDSDGSSASSISSVLPPVQGDGVTESMKTLTVRDHRRAGSINQPSPRTSIEGRLSPGTPNSRVEVRTFTTT